MKRKSIVGWVAVTVVVGILAYCMAGDYLPYHYNYRLMYLSKDGTQECESKLFFDECHPHKEIKSCPGMERLSRLAKGEQQKTCWQPDDKGIWYYDPECLKMDK